MAIGNGVQMWWLRVVHGDHKIERASLVAQIKDSEALRRQDTISQFDKIERFVDKVEKSMNTLVVAFERKGIRTDV